jgi:hypothetical protein
MHSDNSILSRTILYNCSVIPLEEGIDKELAKMKIHPVTWTCMNPMIITMLQMAYDFGVKDGYDHGYDDGFDRSDYYYWDD